MRDIMDEPCHTYKLIQVTRHTHHDSQKVVAAAVARHAAVQKIHFTHTNWVMIHIEIQFFLTRITILSKSLQQQL